MYTGFIWRLLVNF